MEIYKKTADFEIRRSLVGARGFEPPTSCTPCKRASRTAPRPEQRQELYADCVLLAMQELFFQEGIIGFN